MTEMIRIESDGSRTPVEPKDLHRGDLVDIGDGAQKVVAVDMNENPPNVYVCDPDCRNPMAPALMGGVIGLPSHLR
jgi:hypothetical protein